MALLALLPLLTHARQVSIEGMRMLVDGAPLDVRGICYSPVPVGESPNWTPFGDYFTADYAYIWLRDLPVMRDMRINVIRIYGWSTHANHKVFLDTCVKYGIRVLITFYVGNIEQNPVRTPFDRSVVIQRFAHEVKKYGDHPGILMWSFGNELNGPWNGLITTFNDVIGCGWDQSCMSDSANWDLSCNDKNECVHKPLFFFINAAIKEAKKYTSRPIISTFADLTLLTDDRVVGIVELMERYVPEMDAWGVQLYRGSSFGSFFLDYLKQTGQNGAFARPVFLTEFGVDAYNDPCGWAKDTVEVCFSLPHEGAGGSEVKGYVPCADNFPPNPQDCDTPGEIVQAEWDLGLAKEAYDQSSFKDPSFPIAGSFVMSWTDEFWKGYDTENECKEPCKVNDADTCREPKNIKDFAVGGKYGCTYGAHFTCGNQDPFYHDLCGYRALGATFDWYVNEEWFGIQEPQTCAVKVPASYGAHQLNSFTKRPVMDVLAKLFQERNGTAISNVSTKSCEYLMSCWECATTHTLAEIEVGMCDKECSLDIEAQTRQNNKNFAELFGEITLVVGLAFLAIPLLIGCVGAVRKRSSPAYFSTEFTAMKKTGGRTIQVQTSSQNLAGLINKCSTSALKNGLTCRLNHDVDGAGQVGVTWENTLTSFEDQRSFQRYNNFCNAFSICLLKKNASKQEEYALLGMLQEHVELAQENLLQALKHEIHADKQQSLASAVDIIHYRLFEGYFCWAEKHSIIPISTGHPLAECLVFRALTSLAEQILNCPERLAQCIHQIFIQYRLSNTEGSISNLPDNNIHRDNVKDTFVIHLDFLQEGLKQINKGTLNFDDVNQCASMNGSRLQKFWYEPKGFLVLIDICRSCYPILVVKYWMLALALFVNLSIARRPPLISGLEFWTYVALVDAIIYCIWEFIVFFYTVLVQERGNDLTKRSWQGIAGLALSLCCLAVAMALKLGPELDVQTSWIVLIMYVFVGRLIIFLLYLPLTDFLLVDPNYVRFGRPRWVRRQRDLNQNLFRMSRSETIIEGADSQGALPRYRRTCASLIRYIIMQPLAKCGQIMWERVLFWFCVFGISFGMELVLVAPIGQGFTFDVLCNNACQGVDSIADVVSKEGSFQVRVSRCDACTMAIIVFYTLMYLASLIDMYIVFNVVIGIVGYFKGLKTGVYSTTRTNYLPNPYFLYRALSRLFGNWDNALRVWDACVAELRNRDFISTEQQQKLIEALPNANQGILPLQAALGGLGRMARDRLMFLLNTLPNLAATDMSLQSNESMEDVRGAGADVKPFRKGGLSLNTIPTVTQLITMYGEEVTLGEDYLKQYTGVRNNLAHIISEHQSQWTHFVRRVDQKSLLKKFLNGKCSPEIIEKIRLWSSERAQTVARTIRGALAYHDALKLYLQIYADENTCKLELKDMVELVIAAQIFSATSADGLRKRKDLEEYLINECAGYPISVVYDYDHTAVTDKEREEVSRYWVSKRRVDRDQPVSRQESFSSHPHPTTRTLSSAIPSRGEEMRSSPSRNNSMSETSPFTLPESEREMEFPFRYATCVRKLEQGVSGLAELRLAHVLPRRYPLRLGPTEIKTQGKAANHVNACKKIWGHVTQVLDANMDGFVGEGLKVPFVTNMILNGISANRQGRRNEKVRRAQQQEQIQTDYNPVSYSDGETREDPLLANSRRPDSNMTRKIVEHRIIGFREYIYSDGLGPSATVMATSENTFGTIFQRVLGDPLKVRMHYGHPDFFDSFWILNRGGPSKASPDINLSEDVFAGYNAWIRQEDVGHVDILEWQKGRETVFTTSSMFLKKITHGSIGSMRSRDLRDMYSGLSIFARLSLFLGGMAYFFVQWLVSTTIFLYGLALFLLTVARVDTAYIALFDSTLSLQWLVAFGFAASLPFLAEQMLERGIWRGVLHWVRVVPIATAFYLFQNQTVAEAVAQGVVTGKAVYINTGRPQFFTPYTKALAYQLYFNSHYIPALIILSFFVYRWVDIAEHPVTSTTNIENSGAALGVIVGVVLMWIFGPVLFCPGLSDHLTLLEDLKESLTFLSCFEAHDTASLFALVQKEFRYRIAGIAQEGKAPPLFPSSPQSLEVMSCQYLGWPFKLRNVIGKKRTKMAAEEPEPLPSIDYHIMARIPSYFIKIIFGLALFVLDNGRVSSSTSATPQNVLDNYVDPSYAVYTPFACYWLIFVLLTCVLVFPFTFALYKNKYIVDVVHVVRFGVALPMWLSYPLLLFIIGPATGAVNNLTSLSFLHCTDVSPFILVRVALLVLWLQVALESIMLLVSVLFKLLENIDPRHKRSDDLSFYYLRLADIVFLIGLYFHFDMYCAVLVLSCQSMLQCILLVVASLFNATMDMCTPLTRRCAALF